MITSLSGTTVRLGQGAAIETLGDIHFETFQATFEGCQGAEWKHIGINEFSNFTAKRTTIRDAETAIKGLNFDAISVTNICQIENCSSGIVCQFGNNVDIRTNNIIGTDIVGISAANANEPVQIIANFISGIQDKGIFVIDAPNSSIIDNNTIDYIEDTGHGQDEGITIINSNNAFVRANKVSQDMPLQGIDEGPIGIKFNNSTGCLVKGNILTNVQVGMQFSGDCTTPDGITLNTFKGGNRTGLLVSENSRLGAQNCTHNFWFGTYVNLAAENLDADPSNSTFFVPMNNPVENPSNVFPPSGWFDGTLCNQPKQQNNSLSNKIKAIDIYPNPANNQLYFNLPPIENSTFQINVIEPAGKLMMSKKLQSQKDLALIDIGKLKNGSYFLQIITNEGSFLERFIKQ